MNPSYQSPIRDGQNTGAQHGASQNNAYKAYKQPHNSFAMNYLNLQTARYGDIQPFDVFNAVPGDRIPLRSEHEIRTYTLKSPMLSGVNIHKDYYMVPMKAILPNTWELIYTNPTRGDDVPDNAYSISYLLAYCQKFVSVFDIVFSSLTGTSPTTQILSTYNKALEYFVKSTLLLESIFSTGSLPATLGCPMYSILDADKLVDTYLRILFGGVKLGVVFDGDQKIYTLDTNPIDISDISLYPTKITIHKLFEKMRENPLFYFQYIESSDTASAESYAKVSEVISSFQQDFRIDISSLNDAPVDNVFDFSRLVAYQLVCAHYFTNDHVDFIYSADLYRKNAFELASTFYNATASPSDSSLASRAFVYNGITILYDAFSGVYMNNALNYITSISALNIFTYSQDHMDAAFAYLSLIFGFRKSLKYGDYFTGARPTPLAVGDVTAPVVGDGVSAIDMTQKISTQRFLNAVNRFGRKFGDYVKGMTGVTAPPVDTDPKFIAHENFDINGFEVENTGSEQFEANSVTTLLKSRNGKFVYEIEVDTPCILLGVQSYDVTRIYTTAVDKFFYHENRFDMFNKFMQYIGDQAITAGELNAKYSNENPISYTLRYMEYKQAINRASGGFVNNLPSWAFTTDNTDDQNYNDQWQIIDPDFIRSSNVEFDRFYTSLTGLSLGTYFHFIVKFTNVRNASRQMEYAPSIL